MGGPPTSWAVSLPTARPGCGADACASAFGGAGPPTFGNATVPQGALRTTDGDRTTAMQKSHRHDPVGNDAWIYD